MPEDTFDPAFPILVENVGTCGSASAPAPAAPDDTLAVISSVLGGRVDLKNAKAFLPALAAAFPVSTVDGHQVVKYTPRRFGVVADGAEITGWQAAFLDRARSVMSGALPKLQRLESSACCGDDKTDIDCVRNIIAQELNGIVDQFTSPSGAVVQRVDQLFDLLLGKTKRVTKADDVEGQLGLLGRAIAGDEEKVTSFISAATDIVNLRDFYEVTKTNLAADGADQPQRARIVAALGCVADGVDDAYRAFDSVYIGEAERAALVIPPAAMTLAELLGWIDDFASHDGVELLRNCGRTAITRAVSPTVVKLQSLVGVLGKWMSTQHGALAAARVCNAIENIATQLANLATLSQIAPLITGFSTTVAPVAGTHTLNVSGSGFAEKVELFLKSRNKTQAVTVTSSSDVQITGTFPKPEDGKYQVVVRNDDGGTATAGTIEIN